MENKNQPAFPMPIAGCNDGSVYNTMEQSNGTLIGLTKREEFAKTFLAAMISSPPIVDRTKVDKKKWGLIAIEWADVLLTELAKEGGEK